MDPAPSRHSVRVTLAERVRRLGGWLDASPAELVGLAVLLAGATVASVLLWWGSAPQATPVPAMPTVGTSPAPARVVVHVTGEVLQPGVVHLREGDRIGDAIAAAGGPGPQADLTVLNLARRLNDGEQVLVPAVGAASGAGAPTSDPNGAPPEPDAWRPDGRLDLNRATAADLEELPGIGPVLAERIVAWREEHGPFTEVGELREVAGIGERTLANLADLVTV